MEQSTATRTLILCIGSIATQCFAQTVPHPAAPTASSFAGCVQRSATEKDTIVISGDSICAKLTGSFSSEKLIGHQIDLKGVLTERTTSTPASIRVGAITSIGKSCSSTCSLQPPGTRGLRGGEKPGREGGTPGAAPTTPPQ